MHGFRLFLVVSCLALAGASWFAPVASSTRIAATAAGTLAASLLVLVFRRRHRYAVGARERLPEAVAPDREPPRRERRSRKRLHELEHRAAVMEEQLHGKEEALDELRRSFRGLEVAARDSAAHVQQRVDVLEAELRRHQAALDAARQVDEERTRRLRSTLAVHHENLTALERALDAPNPFPAGLEAVGDVQHEGSWQPLRDLGG
jgi:hypothetical protein